VSDTLYAVYHRLRFPSGRTARKFRSRHGGFTEDKGLRWLTASRDQAEEMVHLLSAGSDFKWDVCEHCPQTGRTRKVRPRVRPVEPVGGCGLAGGR
jgi:hypothetical protein